MLLKHIFTSLEFIGSYRNEFQKPKNFLLKKIIRRRNLSSKAQNLKLLKIMEGGEGRVRTDPFVKKLNTAEFQAIFNDELNTLSSIFMKYNYELRIAGGAVRDLLMNKQPKDLDFATTATPAQMKEIFTNENIRMLNVKGEKHGTITARINDKENFEVTTLRIDVITDGRHAEVEFTKDWLLDANRRDLTINSMFLGFDGSVYDYFYGYDDLQNHRVLFVGNADTRIKEDFLRILRYFRFYGRIADKPDKHDKLTLDAIKANVHGLAKISGERIWSEVRKILEGRFASSLILKMLECECAQYIGLPIEPNLKEFQRISLFLDGNRKDSFNPITFITALLNTLEDSINLHQRLKLSAFERDLSIFITQNREEFTNGNDLLTFQKLSLQSNVKREYVDELLKYLGKFEILNQLQNCEQPKFQVSGTLLKENGCPSGPKMGIIMNKLKTIWINSDFKVSSSELITDYLPEILKEFNASSGKASENVTNPKKKLKMK